MHSTVVLLVAATTMGDACANCASTHGHGVARLDDSCGQGQCHVCMLCIMPSCGTRLLSPSQQRLRLCLALLHPH